MQQVALKSAAIFLLALLVTGTVASSISAEADHSWENLEVKKLRIQAELLQRMISRAAAVVNMTSDLEFKVGDVLAANISAMSVEELRDFVEDARAVLADLKKSIDSGKLTREENVTRGIAEQLRERLEHVFRKLNISKEEFHELKERLRHAWSLSHLKKILENIRAVTGPAKAHNLTEMLLRFANKSAEHGNATGLERALNSSCKVLDVLEGVKEKLERLNASPAAIAAIERAMEKIAEARELLESVKEKVHELRGEKHATRHEIRELVQNITGKDLHRLEKEISVYIEKLEPLKEAAIRNNLTDLADSLDAVLSKLKDLSSAISEGKLSFTQAVEILAQARQATEKAEEAFKKASERKELREAVSEELRKMMHSLQERRDKLRNRLSELDEKISENVKKSVDEIRSLLSKLSDQLDEAERKMLAENSSTALKLLNDVKKGLDLAEKKLDALEKIHQRRRQPNFPE